MKTGDRGGCRVSVFSGIFLACFTLLSFSIPARALSPADVDAPADLSSQPEPEPDWSEPFMEIRVGQPPKFHGQKEPGYLPGELVLKLKPNATLEEIHDLSQRFGVQSSEQLFPKHPSVEDRLRALREERKALDHPEHQRWYWWNDKGSKEYQDYEKRLAEEKKAMDQRLAALEELANRLRERQQRAAGVEPPFHLEQVHLLKMDPSLPVPLAAVEFSKNPAVEYAHPNYLAEVSLVPNDPYYSSTETWGQNYPDLWGLKPNRTDAEHAWDLSQDKGKEVVVAVIDTGVDRTHPDLAANMWVNAAEVLGDGVDNDDNGYPDDAYGWNFSSSGAPSDSTDRHGHGTHVSGTIAGVGNNGIGILGVAFKKTKIMALKGLGDGGSGSYAGLAQCVVYAAQNGARVMNCSWGPGRRVPSVPVIEEAIRYAVNKWDCTVVFAAGNSNDETKYRSPANMYETIAVAATDSNDQRAPFSNWGDRTDLAAPGVDVLSLRAAGTTLGGASRVVGEIYTRLSGTSMACPHVAGVAALILSRHPEFTWEQVKALLRSAVDVIPTDQSVGTGRVNAYKAVLTDTPPPVVRLEKMPDFLYETVDIAGKALGANFAEYVLEYGAGKNPVSWTELRRGSSPVDGILAAGWNTAFIQDGLYTFRLTATDTLGRVSMDLAQATIRNVEMSFPMVNDLLRAGPLVEITGTARGTFTRYTLSYGVGATPAEWHQGGITLTHDGTQAVIAGPLGRWDTALVPADQFYTLRLQVFLPGGETKTVESRMVYLESRLRAGWPHYVPVPSSNLEFYSPGDYPIDPQTVYLADLDQDGTKELITREAGPASGVTNSLSVYRADGALVWSRRLESSWWIGQIATGDLDGDGRLEVYVCSSITRPWNQTLLHGFDPEGNELPGFPRQIPGNLYLFLNVVNIDAQGLDELVVTSLMPFDVGPGPDPGLWWQTPISIIRRTPEEPSVTTFYILAIHGGQAGVSYAIWNQGPSFGNLDDDPALEMVTWTGHMKLGAFNMDGSLVPGWPFRPENMRWIGSHTPVIGDLDGDGTEEVVALIPANATDARPLPHNLLYAYNRSGQLLPGWPAVLPLTTSIVTPALGDLDGDGDLEIAIALGYDVSWVHLFHHTGEPVTGWPKNFRVMNAKSTFSNGCVIGDVNGDGRPDVVVVNGGISPSAVRTGDPSDCSGVLAWDFQGNPIDLNPLPSSNALFTEGGSFRWAHFKGVPLLTDLEGDGRLDLLATTVGDLGWSTDPSEFYAVDKARNSIHIWTTRNVPYHRSTMHWPGLKGGPGHAGRYVHPPSEPPLENRFPFFDPTEPNYRVEEGLTLQVEVRANDPDGDPLVLSMENLPRFARFEDLAGGRGRLWLEPGYEDAGTYQGLKMTASDGKDKASLSLAVTVPNVNRSPTWDPMWDQGLLEGEIRNVEVSGRDPDGDPVTLSGQNLPRFASFEDLSGGRGQLRLRPGYEDAGGYTISLLVSDGRNSALRLVRVLVQNAEPNLNRLPVLQLPGPQTGHEGTPIAFTLSGSDPDGDSLTYSAAALPPGAAFNGDTRTFSWTPTYDGAGTYSITFSVTDGRSAPVEGSVVITVLNVNRPPALTVPGPQTVDEKQLLTFSVSATDPDGDSLTLSSAHLPLGAQFNLATGQFAWTPTASQAGTYAVTVSVTDGQSPPVEGSVAITVLNVNRPPALTVPGPQTVDEKQLLTFSVSATDPDGDSLTLSSARLPLGAQFNLATGQFAWAPTDQQAGSYTITFSVTDGDQSVTGAVLITVRDLPSPPPSIGGFSPVGTITEIRPTFRWPALENRFPFALIRVTHAPGTPRYFYGRWVFFRNQQMVLPVSLRKGGTYRWTFWYFSKQGWKLLSFTFTVA